MLLCLGLVGRDDVAINGLLQGMRYVHDKLQVGAFNRYLDVVRCIFGMASGVTTDFNLGVFRLCSAEDGSDASFGFQCSNLHRNQTDTAIN